MLTGTDLVQFCLLRKTAKSRNYARAFTEIFESKIGRITTTGVITEYPLSLAYEPNGITVGPDGAVWFTEIDGNNVGG